MDRFFEEKHRSHADEVTMRYKDLVNAVVDMANVGGLEVYVSTKDMLCTEALLNILEVDADFALNKESAINFFAVDSRPQITLAMNRAITHHESFDGEFQITTAKGNARWIYVK
jgi:hypothetical protein